MQNVVNVKVRYIRPKFDNLEEWMNDEMNVYIGRKGAVFINGQRFPKHDSIWYNPYKVKDVGRSEALDMYKKYIIDRLINEQNMFNKFNQLKGKNLGCWCAPEPCHGDILVEIISLL
jgi:hypothetical protein